LRRSGRSEAIQIVEHDRQRDLNYFVQAAVHHATGRTAARIALACLWRARIAD
jgi:hypothetical protein